MSDGPVTILKNDGSEGAFDNFEKLFSEAKVGKTLAKRFKAAEGAYIVQVDSLGSGRVFNIGTAIKEELEKKGNGRLNYNPDYLIIVKPGAVIDLRDCKFVMPNGDGSVDLIFVKNGGITAMPEGASIVSRSSAYYPNPHPIEEAELFRGKFNNDVCYDAEMILDIRFEVARVVHVPLSPFGKEDPFVKVSIVAYPPPIITGKMDNGFQKRAGLEASSNYRGQFITDWRQDIRYDFFLLPRGRDCFVSRIYDQGKEAKIMLLNYEGSYTGDHITITDLSEKKRVFVFDVGRHQATELKPYTMLCARADQVGSISIDTWQPEGIKEFYLPEGWTLLGVRDMKNNQPVQGVTQRTLTDSPTGKEVAKFLSGGN